MAFSTNKVSANFMVYEFMMAYNLFYIIHIMFPWKVVTGLPTFPGGDQGGKKAATPELRALNSLHFG